MWVKSAQGSQYKVQPPFGGDWLKNRLKRCYFTKTTISGGRNECGMVVFSLRSF